LVEQSLKDGCNVFVVGNVAPSDLPKGAINIYRASDRICVFGKFTNPNVSYRFQTPTLKEACESIIKKLYPANPTANATATIPRLTPARPSVVESSSESEESEEVTALPDTSLNDLQAVTPTRPRASSLKTPGSRRTRPTAPKTPVTEAKRATLLHALLVKSQSHQAYKGAKGSTQDIIPLGKREARIRYFQSDIESIRLKYENESDAYVFIHLGDGTNFPIEQMKSFDDWNKRQPLKEKHIFVGFYQNDASSVIAESSTKLTFCTPEDSHDVFDTTITDLAHLIIDFNTQAVT